MMRMKRYSIMQQIPYLDFIYVRRITPRQKNIWTIFQNNAGCFFVHRKFTGQNCAGIKFINQMVYNVVSEVRFRHGG